MNGIEERYISLLTDFGFKRIFGTAPNKDLLINFLNSLFDGRKVIKSLKYSNSEHVGDIYTERKAIFDVYCESEDGEKFIVEMQNASQKFFKDRSVYYSTFPIREQAPKGDTWNYKLNPVYTVALLNYDMKDETAFDMNEISHHVQLCDTATKRVFYDKLEFIYVEVAKFNKTENELVTPYDKWLYALKNLSSLNERPAALRDKIFDRLFQVAEIAKFTPVELKEYEDSLKTYRDLKNSLDTAEEKGRVEGRVEEKIAIARNLKSMGMSISDVSKATGLQEEEIKALWIYCNSIIIVNVINYQCKTIRYKGVDYPFRLVWFDEYNAEVMISTVILSNQLFSSKGTWSDSLAEYIDNKIIYYVDEGEIIESDNYLQQLLKTNILW